MKKINLKALTAGALLTVMALPAVAQDRFEVGDFYYIISALPSETKDGVGRVAVTFQDPTGDKGFYKGDLRIPETITIPADGMPESVQPYAGQEFNVTSIGHSAFLGARNITKLTIPASVRSTGSSAFLGCSGMEELVFEDGSEIIDVAVPITDACTGTFTSCTKLKKVYIGRNLEYELECTTVDCGYAPFYDMVALEEVTLGNLVTKIPYFCFNGCSKLSKISLNEGLLDITSSCFLRCTSMEEITIPSTVYQIESGAFKGCKNLKKLTFTDGENPIKLWNWSGSEGCFSTCGIKELYLGRPITYDYGVSPFMSTPIQKVTLTGGSAEVGQNLFAALTSLDTVELSDKVTTFGDSAFEGCVSLKSLDLSHVTQFGAYSLASTGFEEFIIPAVMTAVPKGFLLNCADLKKLTVGSQVTTIGDEAFSGLVSLQEIICQGSNPPAANNAGFDFKQYERTLLTVPVEAEAAYAAADVWKEFLNLNKMNVNFFCIDGIYYVSEEEGKAVVSYAPQANLYRLDMVIPAEVTNEGKTYAVTGIADGAFYGSKALTGISIPASVEAIGANAFYGCNKLVQIEVFNPVPPTLGTDAFYKVDTKTCYVYVPTGSLDAYKAADGWKSFRKLYEGAGVEDLMANPDSDAQIFTINGMRVNATVDALPAGLYIIGGRKVIIRK